MGQNVLRRAHTTSRREGAQEAGEGRQEGSQEGSQAGGTAGLMTPPPNKCSFRSSAVRAWAQVPCMGSKVRLGNTPSGVLASERCSVESCTHCRTPETALVWWWRHQPCCSASLAAFLAAFSAARCMRSAEHVLPHFFCNFFLPHFPFAFFFRHFASLPHLSWLGQVPQMPARLAGPH